jgi:biopolymer transport protein TolR
VPAIQQPGSVGRPLSEINVTPFVDVMLVLLVIFMVTAPMMQTGVDVDLPKTSTQPLRLQDEPLILSVKKDGKMFVGKTEVPVAELEAKLVAIFESRDDKELFLRADRDAPYGQVAKAMAAAREAGASKLGMVTEPED